MFRCLILTIIRKGLLLANFLIVVTMKCSDHLVRHAIIDIRSKESTQDANTAESDH
jgi:hypothetical protein